MIIRGKRVTYSVHVLDKLFKEDHLDIINNVLMTGKLSDRFKVITVGGKYEKIYGM